MTEPVKALLEHVGGGEIDVVKLAVKRRDRLAQLGHAGVQLVARLTIAQRLDMRFNDMRRRGEVRLADRKIDHVLHLRRGDKLYPSRT